MQDGLLQTLQKKPLMGVTVRDHELDKLLSEFQDVNISFPNIECNSLIAMRYSGIGKL